jgi:hypothetical protein
MPDMRERRAVDGSHYARLEAKNTRTCHHESGPNAV